MTFWFFKPRKTDDSEKPMNNEEPLSSENFVNSEHAPEPEPEPKAKPAFDAKLATEQEEPYSKYKQVLRVYYETSSATFDILTWESVVPADIEDASTFSDPEFTRFSEWYFKGNIRNFKFNASKNGLPALLVLQRKNIRYWSLNYELHKPLLKK